jgi:hypothetical protein
MKPHAAFADQVVVLVERQRSGEVNRDSGTRRFDSLHARFLRSSPEKACLASLLTRK